MNAKIKASGPGKGFEALRVYDYFKAKKIFSEINKKHPDAYASYGLALIFNRSDNAYFNYDSAAKYICMSYNLFRATPAAKRDQKLLADSAIILSLADTIANRQLQKIKAENSIARYDAFLKANYLAGRAVITEAVYLRDELEFNAILMLNKKDSTIGFLTTHPQSNFFIEALLLRDREIFDELTVAKKVDSYKEFLKKYPNNAMVNSAYERLFEIYRQTSDVQGLKHFVADYPKAPQNLEAWKLLFSLSVKSFSNAELKKFLEDYPAFPLKNSILKELELNNISLFPYQKGDLSGFINADGRLVIAAMYDEVTDFYEGLSVVNKNDSVFFINKENINPFDKMFSDAFVFKNGMAPVKQNNHWFFINRQGQAVSGFYDEISEMSNAIYIVKADDKYGAVDHFGQTIIEPKFYKLGDFKNDFAYYIEDGKYGFVSKLGNVHRAEFEWISDFNSHEVAIIKENNKYGLINAFGKKILAPEYDLILKTASPVFIIVQGNSYGFFSSEGCFLSAIQYDYAKDKPAEYYTNGDLLKLVKKGEQTLVDKNGRLLMPFNAYSEVNFFSDNLMRVKKEIKGAEKYGYLDKRLSLAIPYKYQQAGDFADSLALVFLKNKFTLIDHAGAEIYASDNTIDKLSAHYYLVNDEVKHMINQQGKIVFAGVASVQVLNPWLLIVTLNSGEIKLLYD